MLRKRQFLGYVPYEGKGQLLDFGCGSGKYVAKMTRAGWRAEGLDPSAYAVGVGREAGLVIRQGTLPGARLPKAHYDVVTMWHSLEHVPSPKAALKAIHALLRPGGLLLVGCPRLDSLVATWFKSNWSGLRLPRHLTHFTQETLRRHVETAGFEVARFQPERSRVDIRLSLAWLADETGKDIHRRLARSQLFARVVSHAALLLRRTGRMVCLARSKPTHTDCQKA